MLNRGKLLTDRKLLGRWGESRCEKFLKRKGLKTLARNFSCKTGEVDLIMVDAERTIVFVEVKTRGDEAFAPAESAFTEAKKKRLCRAARFFLSAHHIEDRPCRFDLVTVVLDQTGCEKITHYENAFTP
ncbi:MAG: YraN family protein [Planctomycetota bacterium]|jgi:putative endonuclease